MTRVYPSLRDHSWPELVAWYRAVPRPRCRAPVWVRRVLISARMMGSFVPPVCMRSVGRQGSVTTASSDPFAVADLEWAYALLERAAREERERLCGAAGHGSLHFVRALGVLRPLFAVCEECGAKCYGRDE